jgi:hypothetical protein
MAGARLAHSRTMPHLKAPGFEGILSGTTIEDVIQMSCLALATRLVRVEADGRAGQVYLGGGQVVHAETDNAEGEDALFEILTWSGGRFGIEEGRTPTEGTITRMWQSLLLEAAHRIDESRRPRALDSESETKAMEMSHPTDPLDAAEIKAWVRFTLSGEPLGGRAADVEEQQGVWAYAVELSQAVGQSLGLEALAAIEVRGPQGRAVCRLKGERVLALVGGPGADVVAAAETAMRGEM